MPAPRHASHLFLALPHTHALLLLTPLPLELAALNLYLAPRILLQDPGGSPPLGHLLLQRGVRGEASPLLHHEVDRGREHVRRGAGRFREVEAGNRDAAVHRGRLARSVVQVVQVGRPVVIPPLLAGGLGAGQLEDRGPRRVSKGELVQIRGRVLQLGYAFLEQRDSTVPRLQQVQGFLGTLLLVQRVSETIVTIYL